MQKSVLVLIAGFFGFINITAQSLTYRYAKECSHLRGDNENYALGDGQSASWCEMSKPTQYTDCLCEVEKNNERFLAEQKTNQEEYSAALVAVNDLRREARKLGDAGNYEEALSILKDRVMPMAKEIKTGGDANREKERERQIKYTEDAIESINSMQGYVEPKTITLQAGGSSGSSGAEEEENSISSLTNRVMNSSSSSRSSQKPSIAETHEKHVAANNARAKSSSTNTNSSNNQAKNSGPTAAEIERQRKAEEYARKQAKLEQENKQRQEYAQWKNQQNQENAQIAAATAVGTVSMLAILGKMIYQNMGMVNFDEVYQNEPSFSLAMEFGYSFLVQPIYFNSAVYDGVDYSYNTDHDFTWPVNFDFKLKLGYESDNVGVNAYAGTGIGASIIMHSFNLPTYNYGGQIYAGLPNVKGLFEYQGGGRAFSQNYWLLEEESGDAYSSISYSQLRYGAKFTWGQFTRSHISLGLIQEGITGNDETQVQRIELPEPYSLEDRFVTGYFIEYKKDHSYNFFLNVYPNYPFTGEVEHSVRNLGDSNYADGSLYFLVGFHRSIDAFY